MRYPDEVVDTFPLDAAERLRLLDEWGDELRDGHRMRIASTRPCGAASRSSRGFHARRARARHPRRALPLVPRRDALRRPAAPVRDARRSDRILRLRQRGRRRLLPAHVYGAKDEANFARALEARARPRHRAATDEFPARRGRRPAARPRLSAARTCCATRGSKRWTRATSDSSAARARHPPSRGRRRRLLREARDEISTPSRPTAGWRSTPASRFTGGSTSASRSSRGVATARASAQARSSGAAPEQILAHPVRVPDLK